MQSSNRKLTWGSRPLGLAAFGIGVVVIWQLLVSTGFVSPFILPTPLDTARAIIDSLRNLLTGGHIFVGMVTTTTEVLVGFVIAAVTGVATGITAGATKFGREVLTPYIVAVNAMPKIAFAPVFVAAFGFGLMPKILLAAFIAFFPIVVNVAAGVNANTTNELLLFESMQASRRQRLWRLQLPNSLPYLFAGLRTAAVLAVVGAVVAEFLGGSSRGLGELIRQASTLLAIDVVFGLIFVLSAVGILFFGFISWLERRVVHWTSQDR